MAHFIIFGNSIAYGCWDEKGGWASRLRSYLHGKVVSSRLKLDYMVYNLAVSGDTVEDIFNKFDDEIKKRLSNEEENIIIFSLGVNDSQIYNKDKTNKVSLIKFGNCLKKLTKKALSLSNKVIFIGPTPVDEQYVDPIPWAPDFSYKNNYISKYNNILKKQCKNCKATFLDIFNTIKDSPVDYLADGVHLNNKGHEFIYKKLFKLLKKDKLI
jgi:lysophospholipase L1-like esterase